MPDLSTLSEAELRALRALLDQLIALAQAAVRSGAEADVSLSSSRGTAAAFITVSTEVQQ